VAISLFFCIGASGEGWGDIFAGICFELGGSLLGLSKDGVRVDLVGGFDASECDVCAHEKFHAITGLLFIVAGGELVCSGSDEDVGIIMLVMTGVISLKGELTNQFFDISGAGGTCHVVGFTHGSGG
jgi:hypothetical protein